MLTNYLAITGLSFYMLLIMWWKYILIIPFLLVRRRQLIHKFRFAVLGVLICYAIDSVAPLLFNIVAHRPSDPNSAAEWAQIWMITTTAAKLAVGSALLFFLSRYYETDRRPIERQRKAETKQASMYQSHKGEITKHGIVAAIIGFFVSAVFSIMSISRSTSSTAAIGYLFVPMTSAVFAVPFFVFGFSVGYLRKWKSSEMQTVNAPFVLALVASIGLFLAGAVFSLEGLYVSSLVHDIKSMNGQELNAAIDKPFFGKNKFVLGAVAGNKNASGELLNVIGAIDDNDLYEKMWSVFDVMGENRHGLAVMRLVARNKNVLPETLEHLAHCSNEYVLGDVAGNEKTSVETLIRLSKRKTYLIDWGLARNPGTPPDILSVLSRSDNEYTRSPAAENPATAQKDLERLSSDPVWHVRRSVATNKSATPELLDRLSKDGNRNVRQMVLFNKNVTADILAKMMQDGDSYISQQAQNALTRMK